MKSRPQGQGPGLYGDSTPLQMLPAHQGRRSILLLSLEYGERPLQAEQAFLQSQSRGTALGLSTWGRGLGRGRGSEAPKPFLLQSTTEKGVAHSGLAFSHFLPLTALGLASLVSQGCASGPCNGLASLRTHPASGDSSSSLVRPDLGSPESKGCCSPKPGCFLACDPRGWGAVGN